MESSIIPIIGILLAFLIGLFSSRKTAREDAKILALTGKINDNKKKAVQAQTDADKAVKEYQDALKQYDPNFYSDDDNGGGKPSS